jgi:hypothetical protein
MGWLLDTCRAEGGATTLNAYAAWVADADTRADLSKPEGTVVHLRPGSSAARDFDEPFRRYRTMSAANRRHIRRGESGDR